MHVNLLLHRGETKFIGGSMDVSAANASVANHGGEPVVVVVASVLLPALAPPVGSSTVGVRPNSPLQITRVSEACPGPEIGDQGRQWRDHTGANRRWFTSMSSWLSQGCPAPCQTWINRTALQQATRDEELPGLDAIAVALADGFRLALDVKASAASPSACGGQLKALDSRLDLAVRPRGPPDAAFETLQQIQPLALLR